jgi:transposase
MSKRELRRVGVLARVASEELKLVDAARILSLSYRQVKRIWRRYEAEGAKGLKHRSAGKGSNRAKPKKFRAQVIRLLRKKYSGVVGERFGPTLASEHLASEDQVEVHAETLRRWMLAEGLWSRARKRKEHRERREAREHFGELVQMDGSFHKWFEQRGPEGCLMNLVDDATGPRWRGWERRRRSGRRRECCGVDREVWRAGGPVHGLEECLCAGSDGEGVAAGRGARDAIWADV